MATAQLNDDCWSTIAWFVNNPALMMRVCRQWRRVILTTDAHMRALVTQKGDNVSYMLGIDVASLQLFAAKLDYNAMH
jgi:hypothetical protein